MRKIFGLIFVLAACVALVGAAAAQTAQNVHGTVQSVQGSQLTLKADDGRVLTVDKSAVGQDIQQVLAPGMGVTITGSAGASANQMTAQYIQQDSSEPSRGGAMMGQHAAGSPQPTVD